MSDIGPKWVKNTRAMSGTMAVKRVNALSCNLTETGCFFLYSSTILTLAVLLSIRIFYLGYILPNAS